MKRKLLSLFLILALAAGLSGCAARHEENSADSETAEQSTESVDEQTTEQTAAQTTEQTSE